MLTTLRSEISAFKALSCHHGPALHEALKMTTDTTFGSTYVLQQTQNTTKSRLAEDAP